MNILHNAEAVFAIAVGVTVGAGAMLPGDFDAAARAPAHEVRIATPGRMAVVKVPARRLTVVEKMRSLEDERKLARLAGTARG